MITIQLIRPIENNGVNMKKNIKLLKSKLHDLTDNDPDDCSDPRKKEFKFNKLSKEIKLLINNTNGTSQRLGYNIDERKKKMPSRHLMK